jgi:arylsulfatase A-like enzyme
MAPDRPNVLFICADQWRADCIGALGHPHVRTPNLDALAADGVLFENHYGQCTPCGPSRTSLLTGLYLMNHRSGRNGTPLDARFTNVALEARRRGYEPTLFGYTDTSLDPRGKDPHDPAVQHYDEGVMPGFTPAVHMSEEMAPWIGNLIGKGYDLPNGRADVFRPRAGFEKPADRGHRFIPAVFSAEDSDAAFLTDRFLEWLKARKRRPFFAHVVFLRPHPPLVAPEPYNALVHPKDVAMPHRAATPEEEAELHPFLKYRIDGYRRPGSYEEHSPIAPATAPDLEIRQMMATYFGLIAEVDHHLGRIVAALKENGEYDNTLVVFTSDHGEMLGEHYLWSKEIWFDQAFRVPLVIRDPQGAREMRVKRFTEAIDVAPTIIERIGGQVPRAMDGRSLAILLDGREPERWREAVFFEHDFREVVSRKPETALGISSDECCYAVVRDEAYKYVHFAALPPLLFDMRADPHETRNLAADPGMQGVALAYAQKLLTWRLTATDRTLTAMALTQEGLVEGR